RPAKPERPAQSQAVRESTSPEADREGWPVQAEGSSAPAEQQVQAEWSSVLAEWQVQAEQPRRKSEARLAVERFIAKARQEGNVGRYLLSGASALLVVMAAISFIALVWDSIPAAVKVGALGGLGVLVVVCGATLSARRPGLRVAASTLTGTGGSMGFVAIIGAVVLEDGVIPIWLAFVLMAAWGLALLILSRVTAQFFTAIVSSIGALVTVVFASRYEADAFEPALLWTFVCAYVVVLAITAALLPGRKMRPMVTAPWFPTTSMVVTAYALLAIPGSQLGEQSPVTVDVIVLFLCGVLLIQVFHSSQLLFNSRFRVVAGFDWAVVGGIVLIACAMRTLPGVVFDDEAAASLLFSALVLLLLAAIAVAFVMREKRDGWHRRCGPAFFGLVLAEAALTSGSDGRCLAFAAVAVGLAALPLLREGIAWAMLSAPAVGVASVVFVIDTGRDEGDLVRAPFDQSVLASALIGALLVVVLTVVGERMLDAALRSAWGPQVTAGAAVPGQQADGANWGQQNVAAFGMVGQQAVAAPSSTRGAQVASGAQV
ncbi:MAG: hypothetical protein Q3979_10190, partial [Actinomycetaceae bacterium]|nr:hypothetical protein [Actinomycetaceae bacterium]